MGKFLTKFDPRRDPLETFKLPTLFVVAEVVGPAGLQSMYVLGSGIYTSRAMAEFHAKDLLDGAREYRAKLQRTLDADNRGEIGLSLEECQSILRELSCPPRDIRVLETGKSCEAELKFALPAEVVTSAFPGVVP